MQFIDVTRVFKIVTGDEKNEDHNLLPKPNLYYVKNTSSSEIINAPVGVAVVQTKASDIMMLRNIVHCLDRKSLKRRYNALICSIKRVIKKYSLFDIPTDVKIEFDTDLIEITVIREWLYGEAITLTDDPRPDFLKNVNKTKLTHEDVKNALKDSGKKSSKEQALGCVRCGVVSGELKRCGRCRSVVYCSAECQKSHWQAHKVSCVMSSK